MNIEALDYQILKRSNCQKISSKGALWTQYSIGSFGIIYIRIQNVAHNTENSEIYT